LTMTAKEQKPPKMHARSCVACRSIGDKRELIRFVRLVSGEVAFDVTGRMAGRGAYLCGESSCFDRARKGRLFDRALKTKLSDVDYQRLEAEYSSHCGRVDAV